MREMVLYFTGTGNSRYAAKILAKELADECFSMNDAIRSGNRDELFSERPWVIVTPTYAWRIPAVVEEWLSSVRLTGSDKAWFVMTCGDGTGNAAAYLKAFCRKKGFRYMGLRSVVMPENYIAMFHTPEKAEAQEILELAVPVLRKAAARIRAGLAFPGKRSGPVGNLESGLLNHGFYRFFIRAKGFRTTEACTGCGKCAALCPMRNIEIQNDRPVWGNACTHCMACISACPENAVEYRHTSVGKPRYYLDENGNLK